MNSLEFEVNAMDCKNEHTIVRSASRALDVLELIVKLPKAPSFTTIQRMTGIPKSSLSYLLQELINKQYLEFDYDMKVYLSGLKFVCIAANCINNTNFSNELWRGVKQLSAELDETTHAAILEDRFAIFIAKHACAQDVSAVLNIGSKLAAHATACGKVMLSSLTDDELDELLGNVIFEQYTTYTVTSYDKLLREIKRIRKYGYAFDYQGNVLGGFCVAAPVRNREGKIIAAISSSILIDKINLSYLKKITRHVKLSARNISMRLGYMDNTVV